MPPVQGYAISTSSRSVYAADARSTIPRCSGSIHAARLPRHAICRQFKGRICHRCRSTKLQNVQGAFMPPRVIHIRNCKCEYSANARHQPDVQGLICQPTICHSLFVRICCHARSPEVQGSYQPELPAGFTPDGSDLPPTLMPGVANEGILEESSPFYGFDPNVAGGGFNQEPYYGAPMNPEQINAQVKV